MITLLCGQSLSFSTQQCGSLPTAAQLCAPASCCTPPSTVQTPIDLPITPSADPSTPDAFTLGPLPADTPTGVWTLQLTTDCGCFSASVHVATCPPPAHQPAFTHDPVQPTVTECCPEPTPPVEG